MGLTFKYNTPRYKTSGYKSSFGFSQHEAVLTTHHSAIIQRDLIADKRALEL